MMKSTGIAFLGEHLLAKDEEGRLKARIATVFPRDRAVVTLPGIHAIQRSQFLDWMNQRRRDGGQAELSSDEIDAMLHSAVDLVMENESICIRPDPTNMPLAFEADDLLQELAPKHRIRFLLALDERVSSAIKFRGECWRIAPLPKSAEEMKGLIRNAKIGIGGHDLYYHSGSSGTRYLTYESFFGLGDLDTEGLRAHLIEIQSYSARRNAVHAPEVDFFGGGKRLTSSDFAVHDFDSLEDSQLRAVHAQLSERYRNGMPVDLMRDDPENAEWRNQMCVALLGQADEVITEETLLGLSSEFFMQIQWLAGGRIDRGELFLDKTFDYDPGNSEVRHILDEKARSFLLNFVREYGDLEYVNIGRVIGSLSRRKENMERRGVYIAEFKQRGSEEVVSIIRKQKWGIHEHLDSGRDLLEAVMRAEEYTEYVLDRRLGCRQLGMRLPRRVTAKRVPETYRGEQMRYYNAAIWFSYFERDYIQGIATDKIPRHRFSRDCYALKYARLLGQAAAPNMIVGRCSVNGKEVLFDDGDEVIVENDKGIPVDLIVADQTGTFGEYERPLVEFAEEYAAPINRLLEHVPDGCSFAASYLDAFEERFRELQAEYQRRKVEFDTLFRHHWYESEKTVEGSFAYRWERVLRRLAETDPRELRRRIQSCIRLDLDADLIRLD